MLTLAILFTRSQKHEQVQSQKKEQRTTSEHLAETTAQPR